ncbi:MAG: acyl--CoA ligase, partial [Deltaproteobacteria bacterium]|nr:acyl--CoA ligase [Deltaproteobacteria bacterium]
MEEPKTLVHMLEATCRLYPSRIALIQDNRRMTYGDLYRAASSVAKAMARRGVVKGDRVMIALPNVPEFVIAYFAAVKLGAVAVTVNIAYTSHELLHLIQNSGAKAFITTPSVVKKFLDIRQETPHCTVLIVTEGT